MNRSVLIRTVAGLSLFTTGGIAFAADAPVQVYQTAPAAPAATTPPPANAPVTTQPVAVPVQTQPSTVVVNQAPPPPPPENHDHDAWGEFNIGGGMAMFQGDSDSAYEDSPSVDLGFFGPMGHAGQWGVEFGYVTGADLKGTLPDRLAPVINGTPATGAFTGNVTAHILRATPELRFGPLIKTGSVKIMPYVVGGGGFYWTRYNDDDLNFGGTNASLSSNNDYNGGWNAGGGLEISLSPSLGIGADVRYHDIIYSGTDTTYLVPSGKLILYF
jgi:opacity protein-like surface antigen